MQIRPYQSADYQAARHNLDTTKLTDEDVDTKERLTAKIARDPESILVAEIGGKVVGNVFFLEDGWNSLIFRLAVQKEHQGKGIGGALLEAAEQKLKSRGHRQVMLMVRDSEDDLKEFYTRRGYVTGTTGPHRFFYKYLNE